MSRPRTWNTVLQHREDGFVVVVWELLPVQIMISNAMMDPHAHTVLEG